MNIKDVKCRILLIKSIYFLLPCIIFFTISCEDKIDKWEAKSEEMVIADYVNSNPDQYSEFYAILEKTGIKNLLRVRGPFTLFLPTNAALQEYYKLKNVNSYLEFDTVFLSKLVYNHVVPAEITSNTIGIGALPDKNAVGDYITSDLLGADIFLNKFSKIVKRDILTANGYVHQIDKVIDLVTENIYTVIAQTPGYSIFVKGLEATNIKDTLQTISFPYGDIDVRAFFTILAVPDTLFQRFGINSFENLVAKYSDSDDLTNPQNGLYQFMEYHVLSQTYYLSDFSGSKVYPIFNFNRYMNIDASKEYKINPEGKNDFTTFYLELSNIPAKNGTIHAVSSLLPPVEAKPALVEFETTDFFDLKQMSCYGKYYRRFYDGQNDLEGIKWEADYLMYYYKEGQHLVNDDALNVNGHFWIELTTPRIMKGKYRLSSFWFAQGTESSSLAWYLDGESLDVVIQMSEGTWNGSPIDIAEIEFKETKQHKIKIATVAPGIIWWDRLIFTPIN